MLPCQVKSISFNPATSSVKRASYLLVADVAGVVRVYDYSSTNETQSSSIQRPTSREGSWQLSLYAGFQPAQGERPSIASATSQVSFGRKPIVDAQWVLDGNAIMVLLADGEWGIWDVEGAAPGVPKTLLGHKGIKGGAKTAFSISGWIEGATPKSSTNRGTFDTSTTSKFAPMTPGTRKTIEPHLFKERNHVAAMARGQISVIRLPAPSATATVDESVAVWFEDSYVVIPSLTAYWQAQTRRTIGGSGSLFGGVPGSRMNRIEGVSLRGEQCSGIAQNVIGEASRNSGPRLELLITGEHRFIVLLDERRGSSLPLRVQATSQESQLRPGELDVGDIEKALAQMGNSNGKAKRNVGFLR